MLLNFTFFALARKMPFPHVPVIFESTNPSKVYGLHLSGRNLRTGPEACQRNSREFTVWINTSFRLARSRCSATQEALDISGSACQLQLSRIARKSSRDRTRFFSRVRTFHTSLRLRY